MSNNVFKFPEHKIVREIPPQIEEIEKAKEKGKQNYAEDIAVDFAESMVAVLDSYGIDQDNENFDKDLSFAVEAIRAMIYRSLGIKHHLHEFIDTHVSVLKKDKDGNLVLESPSDMEEIIISELELEEETLDEEK
jgi:hypothetical protein